MCDAAAVLEQPDAYARLGLVVDGQKVLARSATAAIVLRLLIAYEVGLNLEIDVHAREVSGPAPDQASGPAHPQGSRDPDGGWFDYPGPGPDRDGAPGGGPLSSGVLDDLEIGFGCRDGDLHRGPALRPHREGEPLRWGLSRAGGGSGGAPPVLYYTIGYWVYPYPRTPPLRVALSWPGRGIGPTVTELDIPGLDVVAGRATAIW